MTMAPKRILSIGYFQRLQRFVVFLINILLKDVSQGDLNLELLQSYLTSVNIVPYYHTDTIGRTNSGNNVYFRHNNILFT